MENLLSLSETKDKDNKKIRFSTENNKETFETEDEWNDIEYSLSPENDTIHYANCEFISIQDSGEIINKPDKKKENQQSQFTQTDINLNLVDSSHLLKSSGSVDLATQLLKEINNMRNEIKSLTEITSNMRNEIKNYFKDIKIFNEREKNRYVRSHIPFRFIPEHTVLGYPFGI